MPQTCAICEAIFYRKYVATTCSKSCSNRLLPRGVGSRKIGVR